MKENKKLIVSTRTRDLAQNVKIITRCLQGYPEGLTPKLIALKTGINVNTIKSVLPKIKDLSKPLRGLYKVVKRGDTPLSQLSLFDWKFHNLILTADLSSNIFPTENSYDFGLVKVFILVSSSGRATCRLSCDFPLNVSSVCLVAGFFSSLFGFSWSDVSVSTIEFNHDFKNLRLDGLNSVSVDSLVEQFKLYQKSSALRVEHKTKVPFGVESLVDMLSNNPNSLEFHDKLNQQKKQIERLALATERTSLLLNRLLELRE